MLSGDGVTLCVVGGPDGSDVCTGDRRFSFLISTDQSRNLAGVLSPVVLNLLHHYSHFIFYISIVYLLVFTRSIYLLGAQI